MAQAGFTPIITYHSTTPAAVPTAGNLAPGELGLNIADMKLYCENSSGVVTLLADAAAQGTVTSVATGTGLTGGTITSTGTVSVATNGITDALLRQSTALSVIGRSANSTGNVADISAGTDNQVLRRSGTSVGFGAVNLASTDAVTGSLAVGNGGTGSNTQSGARTNLGATTVGANFFTLANPSAIRFPRINADNTVSALSDSDFRTAIGAGTGSGTVTSVGGTGTVNGLTLTGTVTSSGNLTLGGTLSNVSLTTQVTGTLPASNGGTGITSLGSGIATWLGTPSSANLAAAITDETGSGSLVFATSPTLVTPILGTPTSGTLSNCTVDGTNSVGYLNIPQVSQSAAYTLVASDSGKHILHPSADTTARTFTIPANSSVPFAIGTAITFVNQNGAGTLTIAITTDTMRLAGAGTTGSRTLAANGVATAIKLTSTEWIISGVGLT